MNRSTIATNPLGCQMRLRERPAGCPTADGEVASVFIDADGLHYVVVVDGCLIQMDDPAGFLVLEGRHF